MPSCVVLQICVEFPFKIFYVCLIGRNCFYSSQRVIFLSKNHHVRLIRRRNIYCRRKPGIISRSISQVLVMELVNHPVIEYSIRDSYIRIILHLSWIYYLMIFHLDYSPLIFSVHNKMQIKCSWIQYYPGPFISLFFTF